MNSGRWKTFSDEAMENEFQVRGGMCWYEHILVAAVEGNKSHEIRLFSREAPLDTSQVLYTQQVPAPVVLLTISGEDSLLVYTYENQLYHFVFVPYGGSVRLVQVGQIAFHGIVRSPARVRGLSWILPEGQLVDGDPSQDVAVASVIFLVDGKLVLLRPSLNEEGQLKYDMRVVAQNVEYHAAMREQPLLNVTRDMPDDSAARGPPALQDSLWMFDGMELKVWTDIKAVLEAASGDGTKEMPDPVSISVDFYPLSVLLEKGIALGVESDLVQRRDVNFSFFHFAIRVGHHTQACDNLAVDADNLHRHTLFSLIFCAFILARTRPQKQQNCLGNTSTWNTSPMSWKCCCTKSWMRKWRRHPNLTRPSYHGFCLCCRRLRNTLTLYCNVHERRRLVSGRRYSPTCLRRRSCLKSRCRGAP